MTDADVALHRERDGQPDRRVAARVAEPHDVRPVPDVERRRRAGVVVEDDDEDEAEVEDVVDGERRQVAVGRRLHRPARQHGDVHRVRDDAERDDRRHQDALDDEPSRRQLVGERQRLAAADGLRPAAVQRRRRYIRRRHRVRQVRSADVGADVTRCEEIFSECENFASTLSACICPLRLIHSDPLRRV